MENYRISVTLVGNSLEKFNGHFYSTRSLKSSYFIYKIHFNELLFWKVVLCGDKKIVKTKTLI